MCLALPGKLVAVNKENPAMPSGTVSYGSTEKEVQLCLVPDAVVGEYVLVHVGFAISRLDEEKANEQLNLLRESVFKEDKNEVRP